MPTHNLSKIFQPHSVAVIGASVRPGSVGQTVLANLKQTGFEHEICAINPKYESLLDLPVYSSIGSVRTPPDLAVIATPAETVAGLVRECGEAGVPGVIILSAGFSEVGAVGRTLEKELANVAATYPDMRIIGPNCLGVMVPGSRLNASFAAGMANPGRVAFISQSGALCTSVLDWSLSEGIGFSYFVSIGNALNVTVGDLIDYLAEDPLTDSIVLYLESVREARRFMSAARAFTRTKPIVVYKAGRYVESAQAAASHTGAMAGVDAVYEAAFKRAGMVRVHNSEDLFDCAELLARHRTPAGPRLAIITNAGGPGVMAVDSLIEQQGTLAALSCETIDKLSSTMPHHWSHQNPIDVLGDALPERFVKALEIVAADPNVDGILLILTPQAMTDATETAKRLLEVATSARKPVLTAWLGGHLVESGRLILRQAGIPTYDSPERAVRAFTYLVSYRRNREVLYETPRQVQLNGWIRSDTARSQIISALSANRSTLTEIESKELLSDFGIPTACPQFASSAWGAIQMAREIGYPVVMKIHSPQILHKTEVHGVALNLSSDHEVQQTFDEMLDRAKRLRPEAEVQGVTLQPMVTSADGVELILGARKDPIFGMVLMLGAGGTTAEILGDMALELPPLNERLARRLIDSLRIHPLLQGYRGRPAVNMDLLVEVLLRFSNLVSENPWIAELDVNPLLVTTDSVIALDARVVLDRQGCDPKAHTYSHLAIRPYPEEYVRPQTLQDGASVVLRPICPEDEPMWHEHLRHCSQGSIWQRFRYLFKASTHEMATRFCFVDYDRTMAIVAEIEINDERQIVAVARLVADADHRAAEYAILVQDDWQGRGLGNLLTDFCFEICKTWGIEQVYAETTIDNQRMHTILRKHHCELAKAVDGDALYSVSFGPGKTTQHAAVVAVPC